jgi:hypothetical protein
MVLVLQITPPFFRRTARSIDALRRIIRDSLFCTAGRELSRRKYPNHGEPKSRMCGISIITIAGAVVRSQKFPKAVIISPMILLLFL